jgi:hypothetical protein
VKATFPFNIKQYFIPGRPFSPGSSAKMNPTASLEVSGPGQERMQRTDRKEDINKEMMGHQSGKDDGQNREQCRVYCMKGVFIGKDEQ